MKKNKMMRIAAVLLIVTLLSTCAISGTFAKYVAKADVEDSARVAKWGIKIETTSNLFADKYVAEDDAYIAASGVYSVESDNGDVVVAPGTSSAQLENGGFSAKLSGKPEVATRFQLKLDLNDISDVFMPFANGYTDYTKAVVDGEEQTFDLVGPGAVAGLNNSYVYGYSPVKWDIIVSRTDADGNVPDNATSISLREMAQAVANDANLAPLFEALFTADGISITDAKTVFKQVNRLGLEDRIMGAINDQFAGHGFRNLTIDIEDDVYTLSMDFDALENCNYRFDAVWAWDYETDINEVPSFVMTAGYAPEYITMIDQADTYLGNVAAGIIEDDNVSTDLKFKFEASATQID